MLPQHRTGRLGGGCPNGSLLSWRRWRLFPPPVCLSCCRTRPATRGTSLARRAWPCKERGEGGAAQTRVTLCKTIRLGMPTTHFCSMGLHTLPCCAPMLGAPCPSTYWPVVLRSQKRRSFTSYSRGVRKGTMANVGEMAQPAMSADFVVWAGDASGYHGHAQARTGTPSKGQIQIDSSSHTHTRKYSRATHSYTDAQLHRNTNTGRQTHLVTSDHDPLTRKHTGVFSLPRHDYSPAAECCTGRMWSQAQTVQQFLWRHLK